MTIGYLVYCMKCGREWLVTEEGFDPVIGFSCEYCSSLGQLDIQQIVCAALTEEQLYKITLLDNGLAKKVDF